MLSFVILSILLGIGHVLRMKVSLFRKLYLPSSVIGGILGLIILQSANFLNSPVPETFTASWGKLPGVLINIVFACLFLGVTIPKVSKLWRTTWKQLAYGQIVAWGQYVVGIGLFLAFIQFIWPEISNVFGVVLPVGFEGGHGTAGGLIPVFEGKGWAAGADFALTSATAGIISAIMVGMILVNWAIRKGYVSRYKTPDSTIEDDSIGIIPIQKRPSAGRLSVNGDVIETFSLHLVIVAVAILFGYLMKEALLLIQSAVPVIEKYDLFSGFPLFPLCMLGGLIIQLWAEKYDSHKIIDLGLMRRIQNCALDYLIVSAIAMIKLTVVLQGIVPLLILVVGGILWNVFCVTVIARRVFKTAWFERAIAEMGQSMGVTATGLLLLRVVDPDYETDAAEAFASKQLLHEPIMGGGLWTGIAIPLTFAVGPWPVFGITVGALVFWFTVLGAHAVFTARR